jgi:hypothetical protein
VVSFGISNISLLVLMNFKIGVSPNSVTLIVSRVRLAKVRQLTAGGWPNYHRVGRSWHSHWLLHDNRIFCASNDAAGIYWYSWGNIVNHQLYTRVYS